MSWLALFYYSVPGGPLLLLLAVAVVLVALLAQGRVASALHRYGRVPTRGGLTGAQVARAILQARGVEGVRVEMARGWLGDHYDPVQRTLRLRPEHYDGSSVAAVGVAAHEVGHALQQADAYAWLGLRTRMVPVVGLGSRLVGPLMGLGVLLAVTGGGLAVPLLTGAVVALGGIVLFSLVTLPVELDASARAVRILDQGGILTQEELDGARQVLRAAAWTYVAAAAMAIVQLVQALSYLAAARRDDR